MKKYNISAVIPTHNRPRYLRRAIDSVLSQTYSPFEVIVVDDGSETSYADDFVREYQDHRIRLIVHEKPKGGNAARNAGILAANGDLVAFLDDDDYWHTSKLERQIPYFSDPTVGAVYCGTILVDDDGNPVGKYIEKHYPSGWLLKNLLVEDVTSGTPTYVVRKRVFDEVGLFDENLPARQDWDMWIRIASRYQIQAVQDRLVYVHCHDGPRTSLGYSKIIYAHKAVYDKYKSWREFAGLMTSMMAGAAYCKSQGDAYRYGQISRRLALMWYLRAIFYCPWYTASYAGLLKSIVPTHLMRILRRNH